VALEGVGGGGVVAGQAAAQGGAEGVGEDGEDDVEVDVEGDGSGERVEAEGLDGFGEALFDGLIANGKFCYVRRVQLSLTWWRRPLDLRRSALHTDVALVGEPDDPDLDRLPPVQPAPRRRAPVGSGLPAAGASGRARRPPGQPDADR
jgi:hypothetical protein